MPIKSQEKKSAKMERTRTEWDEAISDAKKKIRDLQFTIAVYRRRKKAGESWPEPATQN